MADDTKKVVLGRTKADKTLRVVVYEDGGLRISEERFDEQLGAYYGSWDWNIWLSPSEVQKLREFLSVGDQQLKDALRELAQEVRRAFVQVDDVDKSGRGLVSNQGQGMDGYTKLAEYDAGVERIRPVLAKAEELLKEQK